jgi:ribosomal protein L37AE/L43A
MLAPCGHFACAGCHRDYFKAIGNSVQKCGQCNRSAPEKSWHVMWCLTGVATALKKTEQIEVMD